MEATSPEVIAYHKNMVNEIAGDIAKSLPDQWSQLTFGLGSYLSDAEISTAENMRDICKLLMDKKIISYGNYGPLSEVIRGINKLTCDKIEKCTNLIQQARVAAGSNTSPVQSGQSSMTNVPSREDAGASTSKAPNEEKITITVQGDATFRDVLTNKKKSNIQRQVTSNEQQCNIKQKMKLSTDELANKIAAVHPEISQILSMKKEELNGILIKKRKTFSTLEKDNTIPTDAETDLRAAAILTVCFEAVNKS